jgi:hypothetical protein
MENILREVSREYLSCSSENSAQKTFAHTRVG